MITCLINLDSQFEAGTGLIFPELWLLSFERTWTAFGCRRRPPFSLPLLFLLRFLILQLADAWNQVVEDMVILRGSLKNCD